MLAQVSTRLRKVSAMTAITTVPKLDQPSFKHVHAGDVPRKQRTQMERIIFDHTAHREQALDKKPLDIGVTRRSGQEMANYKHEIDHCDSCGSDLPAINIGVLAQTLDKMLKEVLDKQA